MHLVVVEGGMRRMAIRYPVNNVKGEFNSNTVLLDNWELAWCGNETQAVFETLNGYCKNPQHKERLLSLKHMMTSLILTQLLCHIKEEFVEFYLIFNFNKVHFNRFQLFFLICFFLNKKMCLI